ncbi:MAG: (2Fe-2S) ferredoxin domain-containing protein [Bacteroidales bacterium]|nr:(2Fe-2S) ferredoxin domain-containing protein [Bacteroidales bacterium]MBQ7984628.1 (2Fe-2S) ferredoxin domain-containing protein [Bacteroidales bacterium]
MAQIKTLADLQAVKQRVYATMKTRVEAFDKSLPQIRIAMATSGIAAGAKEIFDYMLNQTEKENVNAVITQTGVIAEGNLQPVVVEVIMPDGQSKIYENVDKKSADAIINTLKA